MYKPSTIDQSMRQNVTISKELFNWYEDQTTDTLTFIWDERGEVMYVSNQAALYLQINRHDMNGWKWTSLFQAEMILEIEAHFQKSTDLFQLKNITLPKQMDENHLFNGMIESLILKEETYYICQLKNMAPMEELKNYLTDTDKLILSSQLSAGVVHEIRNPLTSLKGFLLLVQSGIEQKEEYFRVMIEEVEKLERMTQDLLQLAKPDKTEKGDQNVKQLIEDVVFLIHTQMDMRKIDMEVTLEEDLFFYGNASQIKQVLLNLIKNAAEAMNHQGLITIKCYQKEGNVHIEVKDEGDGLTSEQVRELNNPFYTTKPNGTGLGLVVTNHILSMHQGKIEVKSEINNGTTFIIMLPINA